MKETRFSYINGEPMKVYDLVAMVSVNRLWFGFISPKTLKYWTLHIISLGGSSPWRTETVEFSYNKGTSVDIMRTDFINSDQTGRVVKISPDVLTPKMRILYEQIKKEIGYESSTDTT
jgi:hypothetical protein